MQRVSPKQITLFVFFAIVFFASISFLFSDKTSNNVEGSLDDRRSNTKPKIRPSPWVISPEVYQNRATGIRARMGSIKREENIEQIKERCNQLTQHQQVRKM